MIATRATSWVLIACCVLMLALSPPWLNRMLFGVRPGVSVGGVEVGGLFRREVWQLLSQMAMVEYVEPVDATIDPDTGSIIGDRPGVQLDVYLTLQHVMEAESGKIIELRKAPIDSRVTWSDLDSITEIIGTYTTSVGGSENRAFNVGLAAELMNYTVVEPRGLFSFNMVVGPRTYDRGFKPAPVLVGGGTAMDAGGGVCQVSSTLYNSVLAAGLEVAERSPHSKPVGYVPAGRDATVAYEYIDFKFVNDRATPVIVRGKLEGRELTIWIEGAIELDRQEETTGVGN